MLKKRTGSGLKRTSPTFFSNLSMNSLSFENPFKSYEVFKNIQY